MEKIQEPIRSLDALDRRLHVLADVLMDAARHLDDDREDDVLPVEELLECTATTVRRVAGALVNGGDAMTLMSRTLAAIKIDRHGLETEIGAFRVEPVDEQGIVRLRTASGAVFEARMSSLHADAHLIVEEVE